MPLSKRQVRYKWTWKAVERMWAQRREKNRFKQSVTTEGWTKVRNVNVMSMADQTSVYCQTEKANTNRQGKRERGVHHRPTRRPTVSTYPN